MWPFEKRSSGRYPSDTEDGNSGSGDYTNTILDALLDRATGKVVDPTSLAVAETAIGLWERALASS